MKKSIYILLVAFTVLVFAGCKRNNQVQPWNNVDRESITCTVEEKAAENCNMIYSPVCWDDGETYWNACVACSSQKISSYKMWECNCDAENWICSMVGDELLNQIDNGSENSGQEENVEQEEIPEIVVDVPVPNF